MDKAEILKTYGSVSAGARAMGIHRSTLERRLEKHGTSEKTAATAHPQTVPQTQFGKNLDQFRTKYDKNFSVPLKIQQALVKLGAESWEYESGLAKLAGIGVTEIAKFRPYFSAQVVEVRRERKYVWAGSQALAEKMRTLLS